MKDRKSSKSVATEARRLGLTERQFRFAHFYAMSGVGADAAIRAGYAKTSARETASEILAKSNVADLVAELRKEHLNKLGVRTDRVLQELAASAFLDPNEVLDEDGDLLPVGRMPERARRAIKKIKVRNHYDKKTGEQTGRDVDVEFHCKLRATEILGRHLRNPKRGTHPSRTDERLRRHYCKSPREHALADRATQCRRHG